MSEKLLRELIRTRLLVEQTEYDSACQYEIDINNSLAAVGLRSPFVPPPDKPNFCFGTDTGADAYFNAYNPATEKVEEFGLELKAGSGKKEVKSLSTHPVAIKLLGFIQEQNTTSFLTELLGADFRKNKGTGKGLILTGLPPEVDLDSVVIPDASLFQIAEELKAAQDLSISAAADGAIKGMKLYYYFGRKDTTTKHLGIKLPFNLGDPDPSLIGTFEEAYASHGVNYVQVEGMGMFWMGRDPLALESALDCSAFSGNVRTSARYRFKSSSSASASVKIDNLIVEADGEEMEVSCAVLGRTYYFFVVEDLSGASVSGFNLDDANAPQRLAAAVESPPIPPKIETLDEIRMRKFIRQTLHEGNTKGDQYERLLVNALNAANGPITADMQDSIEYDFDLFKGDQTAQVEVKLSSTDQLGKVKKDALTSFVFNFENDRFEYSRDKIAMKGSRLKTAQKFAVDKYDFISEMMDAALGALNDPAVVEHFKKTIPGCTPESESFALRRATREKGMGKLKISDTSFPEDTLKQLCPMKVEVKPSNDKADAIYRRIDAIVPGSVIQKMMKSKNDYLIIGNNDEKAFSGRIGTVGRGDPLGLGVAPFEFGDTRIEIRWGNKGSTENPKHSFTMETRSIDEILGGTSFSSPQDFPGNQLSETPLRKVILSFLSEELTKTDKKETPRLVTESGDSEFKPSQDSPRNIALRLLEEHGLEPAMNIAARDGDFAVLKILMDFGPDAASDVRHFPFGRM